MRISRKEVFSGRLLKVFRGTKRLPNGRTAYFEEIQHPGAVLIVPFIKGKVVFIRQYRGVVGKYLWELPAGTLAPGETPYACAKREMLEETGYEPAALRRIGFIYTTPGFCNEKIYIFRAECGSRKKAQKRDDDELIRVRQLNRLEIRRLFKSGRISDSKTIAALSFTGIL